MLAVQNGKHQGFSFSNIWGIKEPEFLKSKILEEEKEPTK